MMRAARMESTMEKEIEVIDQHNGRHRFLAENHYYEWRMIPGTDIEGSEFLDVFRQCEDDEDSYEVIATFPHPARVGTVTDDTALTLPVRELQMEQCPRCGFTAPNGLKHRIL